MLYHGTQGETANQIAKILWGDTKTPEITSNFMSQASFLLNQKTEDFTLDIANGLWLQTGFVILPSFINTIEKNFNGTITYNNFLEDPFTATDNINLWVAQKTHNKINHLISSEIINYYTRLILISAIYFYSKWLIPFNVSNTENRNFYVSQKQVLKVPTMYLDTRNLHATDICYYEDTQSLALELPYKNKTLSMLIILPTKNTSKDLQQLLTVNYLNTIISKLTVTKDIYPVIYLPKFTVFTLCNLKELLKKVGIKTIFSPNADFSKMTGNISHPDNKLYISNAIHKTFIEIQEESTEAAAATATIIEETAIEYRNPFYISIDKPFVFIIYEKTSGLILFIGRITNPIEKN
jgi:serpin B